MAKRHELLTDDEWDGIDRVTKRYSDAGRAKDDLLAAPPIDGDRLAAVFEDLGAAADDYSKTINRILVAFRERARRRA